MVIKSVLLEFTTKEEYQKKLIDCLKSDALDISCILKNNAVFLNRDIDSDITFLKLEFKELEPIKN